MCMRGALSLALALVVLKIFLPEVIDPLLKLFIQALNAMLHSMSEIVV